MTDFPQPLPTTLRDVFNREVATAIADFPELKGRFVFINIPDDQTIASIEQGRTLLAAPEQFNYVAAQIAGSAKASGTSLATKVKAANLDVLAFMPLPYSIFAGRDQSGEMEAVAEFNHELGHLVVDGAFSAADTCYKETAADVFAALRHIQRYGDDSRATSKAGWYRAFDFIMTGDAGHFSTFGLDALAALQADGTNIAALTPSQTAALAKTIADDHAPDADAQARLTAAFKPAREVMQESREVQTCLKEIARLSLETEEEDTFRTGERALRHFLNGQVPTMPLTGHEWDDIRKKIAARKASPKRQLHSNDSQQPPFTSRR